MPNVPVDGRPQYSGLDVAMASHLLGRPPRVEAVGPDRYVEAGSWPVPTKAANGSSVTPIPPKEEPPKTPGQALWPHLPAGGNR
jgi:hypothetical protein